MKISKESPLFKTQEDAAREKGIASLDWKARAYILYRIISGLIIKSWMYLLFILVSSTTNLKSIIRSALAIKITIPNTI